MLWMIPVAGAAIGALRARQQGGSMLRGAMTGGLLGAGAAYAAPALAASMGGGAAATGAASAAPMATAGTTSGGLLSTALPALNAASQVQGLLGGGQQMAAQMPQQQITGPQTLADIASQGQQQIGGLMDEAMKRRQMNQQIISRMTGGMYG